MEQKIIELLTILLADQKGAEICITEIKASS